MGIPRIWAQFRTLVYNCRWLASSAAYVIEQQRQGKIAGKFILSKDKDGKSREMFEGIDEVVRVCTRDVEFPLWLEYRAFESWNHFFRCIVDVVLCS